jgi:hypothetical membrane protein
MDQYQKSQSVQHSRTYWGGLTLVVGCIQFVLTMIVVQLFYAGYSDTLNPISDLGNSNLSSVAWLYNISIATTGVAGLVATFLMVSVLPRTRIRFVAVGFFSLGNIGLILLGLFPENTLVLGGFAHSLAGQIAFPGYAVAIIAIAFSIRNDPRWKNYGLYSFTLGLVSFVSVSLYGSGTYIGVGPGGMERIFLAADLTWLTLFGLRLIRLTRPPL